MNKHCYATPTYLKENEREEGEFCNTYRKKFAFLLQLLLRTCACISKRIPKRKRRKESGEAPLTPLF